MKVERKLRGLGGLSGHCIWGSVGWEFLRASRAKWACSAFELVGSTLCERLSNPVELDLFTRA